MRVFVKSFGCSTNQADGAVLAGCLVQAGYELVDSVSAAEIVVYNTCAVKGPTENRMIEASRRVPENKKLVITGCLPLINFKRLQKEVKFEGIMGPAAGERIVEVVNRICNGEKVFAIDGSLDTKPLLSLPKMRPSSVVSVIPINYGCLGSCAYCCVVFARGRLRSYTIQEIVDRVRHDLSEGFQEFWLTAQDTACYGRDIGTNLAKLLGFICQIGRGFRVRVGMMTPNLVMDMLDELIEAFRDEKIFKFVHLPVQSGDDQVLRLMRRLYSVDDFKKIVDRFTTTYQELTLATDIICGFPGEDKEAFEHTLRLIEEVRPDIVNVSKFFARPRTSAAEMQKDFVSLSEIKHRSSSLAALTKKMAYEKNKQRVGWEGEILIDEVGKVLGSWVGRNYAYKPVTVKSATCLLGKTITAKIAKAFPTYLQGEVIQ